MEQEKREFVGLDDRAAYLELVSTLPGGTVSPGGAAAILGVSRQRINDLCHEGRLRHWKFYSRPGMQLPEMMDVSVRDLVEYGVRYGRIRSYADVGLGGSLVREEVDRALELVGSG